MSLNGTAWAPIGPSPMYDTGPGLNYNGLVTTIAVNPNNQSVLYLGTAGGGVWRSRDAGDNWTPLFDQQLALGIGEPGGIAIDPNNTDTIYVGTNGTRGGSEVGSIQQGATGLYKSTDGGASWIQLGLGYPAGNIGNAYSLFVNPGNPLNSININIIIVDPADSNVLYLASSNGVYTSPDGGLNWTASTGIPGADTRSLELDLSTPANARILYAGVAGNGVYVSTDGATTFTQTSFATSAAVKAALTAAGTANPTRVVVALAPPTSPPNLKGVQVIYVALAGQYNATDPIGLFISTDQGTTWSQQTAAAIANNTSYGGYCMHMVVDPASPGDGINDTLLFGSIHQFRSTDSGSTFIEQDAAHADTHTYTCVPQTGGAKTVVYIGCDGGVDVSSDAGVTWDSSKNGGGLQTGLFYNIAIRPDATASQTVGALQDNSLMTTATATATNQWVRGDSGDGWDVAYDGSSPTPVLYSTWNTYIVSSTNDGVGSTAVATNPLTGPDIGNYTLVPLAADPSAVGIIYVSGLQNLWQSRDGGTSWRKILSPGNSGNIDVAPTNGSNVVIAAGAQVFVSTNALATTGVAFINITRNLPSRNVERAVFDPVDPTVIYAVLTGFTGAAPANVFWTTIGGTSWTNISIGVDVPCGAIAVDGTTTPTTLYVGTDFGVVRSVDGGASWSVLDNIHFPQAPVFDLAFNAQAGVLRAATYGRGVFEFMKPAGPAIAIGLQDGLLDELDFGQVCSGPDYLTIDVYNVGSADLVVISVQYLVGSAATPAFSVLSTPATPLVISAGEEVTFTVAYTPTAPGVTDIATIRIISNDPNAPVVDVTATGSEGTGIVATAIADNGDFGDVCVGSLADQMLTINNPGSCPLSITGITTFPPDFLAPGVANYPLIVASNDSIDVMIRFRPTSFGPQFGAIDITSNDPASPHIVNISGNAPAPRLVLILADSGDFGEVCVGSFVDRPLILNNSGKCTLTVTGMSSSLADFVVPEALAFPITIAPGTSLPLPIRFAPSSFGAKVATLTVDSNDPVGPRTVNVLGFAPSGKLAVGGSTEFGGVTAHCCADRTVSICNVGDCALHVASVRLNRSSRHWKLLNNPFPATLHSGPCLGVVIRYRATEKCQRPCELIIECDDPNTPVRTLHVLAYTVWESCECKECCEECRKGCCEKRDHGPCCRQGYPCCDDDDDRDDH